MYLAGAKNIDSWCARKMDLQRSFPLHALMVPSSAIIIAADGECFMCGGFSLGETVRLGNFEFITDCFSGLCLSPKRGAAGAAFISSTCSGASTPQWVMIEDSVEEFLTASSGEGSFGPPSPRRRGIRVLPAPVATTTWLKDILDIAAAQQVESSLQCWVEVSVSSPWDISSNQLSHIPNSIFFRVNTYVSLIFFTKYFCGIYSEYTTPCSIMIYAMSDALTRHDPQRLHTLCSGLQSGPNEWTMQ
jgi:hypothetical protein